MVADINHLNILVQKYGGDIEQLKLKWDEFEKDAREFGYVDAGMILNYVQKRFLTYYSKLQKTPTVELEGIFIGITKTDYGAQKLYDEALKKSEENPTQAMAEGYVDNHGIPLYRTPEFKKGQPINPQEALVKQVFGIARGVGDKDYRKTVLNLKGPLASSPVPLGYVTKFKAVVNTTKTSTSRYELSASQMIDFKVANKLGSNDLKQMMSMYYPESITSVSQLKQWHTAREKDFERMAIVLGDVSDITVTDETKSNMVYISDPNFMNLPEGVQKGLTCWVPKEPELRINFDTRAVDIIMIGRTSMNKQGTEVTLNTYGMLVSDMFLIKDQPKSVAPPQQPQPVLQPIPAQSVQPTQPAQPQVPAQPTQQGWV